MKYLGLGMDSEYFVANDFDKNNSNNQPISFDWNLIYKILLYIPLTAFLQSFNNVFYGLTFTPNYVNIIAQGIFIFNLFLLINKYTFSLGDISFNIIYWLLALVIIIVIYLVKNNK